MHLLSKELEIITIIKFFYSTNTFQVVLLIVIDMYQWSFVFYVLDANVGK